MFSKAECRSAILLKQLQLRFGPLSDDVTTRVRSASIEMLDAWARVLSAKSIEDVIG